MLTVVRSAVGVGAGDAGAEGPALRGCVTGVLSRAQKATTRPSRRACTSGTWTCSGAGERPVWRGGAARVWAADGVHPRDRSPAVSASGARPPCRAHPLSNVELRPPWTGSLPRARSSPSPRPGRALWVAVSHKGGGRLLSGHTRKHSAWLLSSDTRGDAELSCL